MEKYQRKFAQAKAAANWFYCTVIYIRIVIQIQLHGKL